MRKLRLAAELSNNASVRMVEEERDKPEETSEQKKIVCDLYNSEKSTRKVFVSSIQSLQDW